MAEVLTVKENQRVRLTKKMLKNSLIRLLKNHSIHKISVIEICGDAQINRTTFYKYYGSQFDLLGDMENDLLEEIKRHLSAGEDTTDMLPQITQIARYINDNIDLCRILLTNNVDPDFPEQLLNLPRIRQIVAKSMATYNKDSLEYLFRFIIDGGFAVFRLWICKENREPPEDIAKLIYDVVMKLYNSKN
jgi:AcrR family transcriptional regulator